MLNISSPFLAHTPMSALMITSQVAMSTHNDIEVDRSHEEPASGTDEVDATGWVNWLNGLDGLSNSDESEQNSDIGTLFTVVVVRLYVFFDP